MLPLDGLRAIAVLWVILLHSLIYVSERVTTDHKLLYVCSRSNSVIYLWFISCGELGVDVFFVLSGFLIGYILLKDCQDFEGQIDYKDFFRNRFFRIWPILFVYCCIYTIISQTPYTRALPALFFINNFVGELG